MAQPRSSSSQSGRNVVLVGYRGSGKSTVAQRLALALRWEWVDADVEIERRAGQTIKQMFQAHGEAYFRDQESAALRAFVGRENTVFATGGGVVLREENRSLLKRLGRVAWLTATVDAILDRIAGDATTAERRPNLTSVGGRAEVELLLAQREPWYRQCADVRIATDGRRPDEIAAEIIERFGLAIDPPGAP